MSKKYDNFYDKMMKYIISHNLRSFFLFFGLCCLPFFPIRNEIIDEDLNSSFLDYPVMTMKGIVNWEFQLDRRKKDDRRFVRYTTQLFEKFGYPVYAVVVDFKAKQNFIQIVNIGGRSSFTIYVKSLMAKKADKVLYRINYKIENKIRLTGVDIVGLEILPLLDPKRKKELLDVSIEILLSLNEDLVSLEKIKEIRDVLMIYSKQWGYEENLNKLGSWSEMYEELAEDAHRYYHEMVLKRVKAEGREEMSYEVAVAMIKEGFPPQLISKISQMKLSEINQLMLAK